MALINSGSKSNRLLASRRFTSTALNTSQEAFTSVLDIQASEVYTQANLIPNTGLPFSGSSQHLSTFQSGSKDVLKYYYRQRLTKSNVDTDVWFFIQPSGSNSGVTPQLLQGNQQTNFVSPKYGAVALANSTAEDATPGYGVKVYKSTTANTSSLGGGDVVSANDYEFDYKTGVLQFNVSKPSASEIVYVTAYQYVGNTLADGVDTAGTGSFDALDVDGNILPASDDSYDIGMTGKEWKNLFIDGTANIDTLSLTDGFTYGGVTFNENSNALTVTGSTYTFKSTAGSDLFTIKNNSDELVFQVDDRVVVLGSLDSTPTAVAGGIFYSGSDAWFLGFEGSGLP